MALRPMLARSAATSTRTNCERTIAGLLRFSAASQMRAAAGTDDAATGVSNIVGAFALGTCAGIDWKANRDRQLATAGE